MSKRPAQSPLRRFLRGLFVTSLVLLLPCQLALLWLATLEEPVALPGFVTSFVTDRLAAHGVRVQARGFWMLPDRTLVAEDVSVEIEGLTGELFTAERVEVGVDGAALLAGRFTPTRLHLSSGSLWCPASASRFGQRRLLAEKIDCDFAKEGRWLIVTSLRARSGRLSLHLLGELPAGLLSAGAKPGAAAEPLPRRLALGLAKLEHGLLMAERSGGASVNLQAQSRSNGGAFVNFEMLLGNDWLEREFGLIQAKDVQLSGRLSLDAAGALGPWRMTGQAREVALRGLSAERVKLGLSSQSSWLEARGELLIENLAYAGLGRARVRATLSPRDRTEKNLPLEFTLSTADSIAEGRAVLGPNARPESVLLRSAALSADELRTIPAVRDTLRNAHLGLEGSVLLQDCTLLFDAEGGLSSSRGRASATGFSGLGITAAAISPDRDQPLLARYDFEPKRLPHPLKLEDLRLATVTGRADCSLKAGGPYVLQLRGDIAPASLNGLLGHWWLDLWQMLRPRAQPPYATISVEGDWGVPSSTIVGGRVRLRDFEFMHAPFRAVEVSVNADRNHTFIGLHGLAGGLRPEDGAVEGSAVWDWTRTDGQAGPVVRVAGDLQPWVAARCVSPELSAALRNLSLPRGHRFSLEVTPGAKLPRVVADVQATGDFVAWGVPGNDLTLHSVTEEGAMTLTSGFGLAGGRAQLELRGNPLKEADVSLALAACHPGQLSKLIEDLSTPAGAPAKPATGAPKPLSAAKLDLKFKGQIKTDAPLQLRGLGSYSMQDPDLRKIRILGGLSTILETIGVDITTYDLTQAEGTFGCLGGQAYFPDMRFSGPQSHLDLAGQVDLEKATLNFEGDFSLLSKGGLGIRDFFNLNRTLISLTKIRVKGPLSHPEISTFRSLSDILNSKKESKLGKIPAELSE